MNKCPFPPYIIIGRKGDFFVTEYLPISENRLIFAKFLYISIKRRMKKIIFPIVMLVVALTLFSCGSMKKFAYYQNIDTLDLTKSKGLYDAKIMPKDGLSISVNCTDSRAAAPFNLNSGSGTGTSASATTSAASEYLVDNNGYINFPVIGMIKVAGLSKRQCEELIHDRIKPYMAEKETPIVTVRMSSFKVCVYGEVANPGEITVADEKISLPEALANAGDLTIYGKRDNILLIREDASGQKTAHRLDLTDANIINSPFYYLQQNDQIYVEPNNTKKRNSTIGSSTTLWVTGLTTLTSLATLVVTITRL